MAMQAKVNATVVDDAVDQARQAAMKLTWGTKDEATGNVVGGYKNLKGEQAFRRPSETGLDDEIGQQFDDAVKTIVESKITNPLQRQSFEHQVMEIGSQLRQGVRSTKPSNSTPTMTASTRAWPRTSRPTSPWSIRAT
jgi:hypothetical protein